MVLRESILDDYTPDEKRATDVISSDIATVELEQPSIFNFPITIGIPVATEKIQSNEDGDITIKEIEPYSQPFIKRTYEFLENSRAVTRYSEITFDYNNCFIYKVGISHRMRQFAQVARFLANLYVCLQGKMAGANRFKIWIHTRKSESDYVFWADSEYWFDELTFGNILSGKWEEIDTNHYVLSAVYRFLDDGRDLPYNLIGMEKVCTKIEDVAIKSWKEQLANWVPDQYVCELVEPRQIDMMFLCNLAKICEYSYISLSFPLAGKQSVTHHSIERRNEDNDDDAQAVQNFFSHHPVTVDKVYFGCYVENTSRQQSLYAIIYLGSIPNFFRGGRATKGITRCGITIVEHIFGDELSEINSSVEKLCNDVSRVFNDNFIVYDKFRKTAVRKFNLDKRK